MKDSLREQIEWTDVHFTALVESLPKAQRERYLKAISEDK